MIDERLTTLRAFAVTGTVAATASLTGYSASAVSAQLRELQKELGMTLLVRDGRNLRLTATGHYLVDHSDTLVAEWERLKSAALSEGNQTQSRFGIGGFSTAASNLLAPLAAHLRREHPDLRVHVVEADPARCLDLLVAEVLDLAMIVETNAVRGDGADSRFERIALLDDPLDVLMHRDHRLAGEASLRLADLVGEEWITAAPGAPYHELFTSAFAGEGVYPRVGHEVVEWETAIALVGAGLGLGLVPRLVNTSGNENVTRVRLSGERRPVRHIVAVVRRGFGGSDLVAASLTVLRATAAELNASRLQD